MANLLTRMRSGGIARANLGFQEWVDFAYNGNAYGGLFRSGSLEGDTEQMASNFEGYVHGAYQGSPIVFACMHTRMMHLSEVRFAFQRTAGAVGIPGDDLFTSADLGPLERPWPGGSTKELVARMSVHADLAGNAYVYRPPGSDRLYLRRPDWMSLVLLGDGEDPDEAELARYVYTPGGPASGEAPVFYEPEDVAHYAPIPDPLARYVGMSWITPVIREVLADRAATGHKERYFTHGATPNVIVMFPGNVRNAQFTEWVDAIRSETEGPENAGKTMFLGGGATGLVAGNSLREVSFKEVQGAGETRIAAAASTPPVIVGLSEGLNAATYANYQQARRRFGDGTCRPLWGSMAGALANIIRPPAGGGAAELWYNASAVAFLREDEKDVADVRESQSRQIVNYVREGFTADSAVDAVVSGDLTRLTHTGLPSVQVQQQQISQNGNGEQATVSANGGSNGRQP